jgi:hypothetical protein
VALSTFVDLWRDLLVLAPNLPIPFAQRAVNVAYRRALDSFRWSALRGESEFYIPVPETTGTVDVTQNSLTVTGAGTAWTSALVGRQFFVGGKAPYYTVAAVSSPTSLTLDRVWGAASATGQSYSIQLVYLTPVSDFLQFTDIRDVTNNWRWMGLTTVEFLDKFDAQRSYSGTSYVLAAVPPGSTATGFPRYEIYPRPPGEASYPYRYIRRPAELSANSDVPLYPIRPETLRYGALAEIAKWPGTSDRPNPYFDTNIFAENEAAFQESVGRDNRIDQEINPTDLSYEPVSTGFPSFPWSASFIQSHPLPGWW